MVQWLVDERITSCFLATPLAEAVMEEHWPEGVALRRLLTGGDRLHRAPPAGLPFELVNHYGRTECRRSCSISASNPCPLAYQGSFTSQARGWLAAISTGQS